MGYDPLRLPDSFKRCMEPVERKELKLKTTSESHARLERSLEREQQRILASWLKLREDDGVLVYDWSSMHKRSTCRRGLPDFRLYAQGRVLLGEMKVDVGELSQDQSQMIDKFRRSGTGVQIWYSAAQAIEAIRDWLMSLDREL